MMRINILKTAQSLCVALSVTTASLAQSAGTQPGNAPENWFNLDPAADKVYGVSTEKAYAELLKDRKAQPVVVAVIDGGVDVNHEDLKSVLWTNPKETPANGKDDDNNGYIDDVYGWNFIGGKDSSVQYDNLELTRLYRVMKPKFATADPAKLAPADKKEYERFQKVKTEYEKEAAEAQKNYLIYSNFKRTLDKVRTEINKEEVTLADVQAYKPADTESEQVKQVLENAMGKGVPFAEISGQLAEGVAYFAEKAKYHLNPDFDPRATVGDNYADPREKNYGNADVTGPDAEHGTHVAGIVAAARDNNLGMKGVAATARIMTLRVVPNGDERDKDVANGIRYAVDNGARIINMSFGKSFSWNKEIVDEAVRYAAAKDVLLVHAAGNDGQDNDTADNFPNDEDGANKEIVPNWVEVGASSWEANEKALGEFSNYGKTSVDVFAPGVAIYSTMPGSKYKNNNGTSMAAPVVSGVAALVRSYFPQLTAPQVKEILMKSAVPYKPKVIVPGTEDKQAALTDLSKSGGIVNAYEALKLAEKMAGGAGTRPAAPGKAKRKPRAAPARASR